MRLPYRSRLPQPQEQPWRKALNTRRCIRALSATGLCTVDTSRMELGTGSMTLCGLPRKNHAASGVRIRFVRRRLALGKRGDRIAAFLNVALETDGPAALQVRLGYIAGAARSPKQEESPRREERSMRTGLGVHPHSAAYPHLAPAAHPHSAAYPHLASGRSSALGDITKVRRKE